MKNVITMLIVLALLAGGAIYERNFIHKEFSQFSHSLTCLYQKVEDSSATEDDVYSVQQNWLDKKRKLHAFIPHNEIKEIDLWIAESVLYVKNGDFQEALAKIEVLIELAEQIPTTFSVRFENIL